MTAIIHTTVFQHREFMSVLSEESKYEMCLKSSATAIAKMLRKEGIRCQVLRGNGSTSASGSDKAKNYFVIEPVASWESDDTNELYLNFDMTEENAKAIVEALKKYHIPFVWEGTLGSCFVFHLNKKGVPE